jgi:predicted HAD superfamily Cof-like phosphohydrolase
MTEPFKCPQCGGLTNLIGLENDITAFHTKFGLDVPQIPRHLKGDELGFRVRFLQEELDEYATSEDLYEKLDALIDMLYVLYGTAYLHGFMRRDASGSTLFQKAWERVHAKNMEKIRAARPEDSTRDAKFDIVKPKGWTPPDHTDLCHPTDGSKHEDMI